MPPSMFACQQCGHVARVVYTKVVRGSTVRRLACKSSQCGYRWTAPTDTCPTRAYRSVRHEAKQANLDRKIAQVVAVLAHAPATIEQISQQTGMSSRAAGDIVKTLRSTGRSHIVGYPVRSGTGIQAAIHGPGAGIDVQKQPALWTDAEKQRRSIVRAAAKAAKDAARAARRAAGAIDDDPADEIDAARKARLSASIQPFRDAAVVALFGNSAYFTIDRRQQNGVGQAEKVLRDIGRHAERGTSQAA